jgi:hypothetical protein
MLLTHLKTQLGGPGYPLAFAIGVCLAVLLGTVIDRCNRGAMHYKTSGSALVTMMLALALGLICMGIWAVLPG